MPKFKLASEKGLIICTASVSGKGKPILLRLALDTGATKTIIPFETAMSIGINPANSNRSTEIATGSGMVICQIVIIPAFSCFGITRKKFEVVCHNLPFEGPVDGLLGLNFFKDTKLILDFARNKIEITI